MAKNCSLSCGSSGYGLGVSRGRSNFLGQGSSTGHYPKSCQESDVFLPEGDQQAAKVNFSPSCN